MPGRYFVLTGNRHVGHVVGLEALLVPSRGVELCVCVNEPAEGAMT